MPRPYGSFMSVPPSEMRRHVAFCVRALADAGAADICVAGRSEVMPLWMRRYRGRPHELELQLSSGHLGRAALARLDAQFASEDMACTRRFSPKRKQLSRLVVRYPAADPFTPLAVINTLDRVSRSLGVQPPFYYEIWHRGPFDGAYIFRPDDPVARTLSYRTGHAVGRAFGKIARAFSPNDTKP